MSARDDLMAEVSRVVGEVAGAVSLCWEPRPDGVFDSTQAATYVDGAVARLSNVLKAEEGRVRDDERERLRAIADRWEYDPDRYDIEVGALRDALELLEEAQP